MKNKLLLACPLSHDGHTKVNKFFYKTFCDFYKVDFIDTNNIPRKSSVFKKIIWKKYDFIEKNRILIRLQYLLRTKDILEKAKKKDFTVFLTYEIFSFCLAHLYVSFFQRKKKTIYLLASNQIDEVSNSIIKKYFWLIFQKKYIHLVKEPHMLKYCKKNFPNTSFSLIKRNINPILKTNFVNDEINKILNSSKGKKVVFCPSKTSSDINHINEVISDRQCLNDIYFIFLAKDNSIEESGNTSVIKGFISEEFFSSLFNISDLIWLPYKTSFKYRSSSMLMEVLNYKKPIIARRIETFQFYFQNYNIGSTYVCKNDFYKLLDLALEDSFEYNFDKILNDFSNASVMADMRNKINP